MSLTFDSKRYEVKTIVQDGITLVYRAYEKIPYCEHPADEAMERLSIYVNEEQCEGKAVNGYSLETAPIFMPNTVGGYMPGPIEEPGEVPMVHVTNAAFHALCRGYVVVSPGIRGRGMKNEKGENIGIAPAHIVDYKAAVRYLKANAGRVPGDTQKIISNGTSAGGAISSLLGASGNHPDYLPYLEAIGAADADDAIFAASCYCPITNLDHADAAYEWEFCGIHDYHTQKFDPAAPEGVLAFLPVDGEMDEKEIRLSDLLASSFPAYLNSLQLKDADGNLLTLNDDGSGSFKDYLAEKITQASQKELDRIHAGAPLDPLSGKKYAMIRQMAANTKPDPTACPAVTIEDGVAKSVDMDAFIRFRTRMKKAPAFDSIYDNTAENELFGSPLVQFRHFTELSLENDASSQEAGAKAGLAQAAQIRLMNPMNYIEDPKARTAQHYRIRHGAVDRDTSLAISEILALKLQNNGVDVDIQHPWGINHAGDYDLEELFAWIDRICKG